MEWTDDRIENLTDNDTLNRPAANCDDKMRALGIAANMWRNVGLCIVATRRNSTDTGWQGLRKA